MLLKNIRGLKFPEEFLIKYFYKEKLFSKPGSVLELGCGNGNNLSLFFQYDWSVTGIDISETAIADAENNFAALRKEYDLKQPFSFSRNGMLEYIADLPTNSFDALILPNSLYYLNMTDIHTLLGAIRNKRVLRANGSFFFKIRLDNDYRFGKGPQTDVKTFTLDISETGEQGCTMTFFSENEFIKLLKKYFEPAYLKTSATSYVNFQNDKDIYNSELVVWGNL